jgi:tRNA-splicing ligase RtcB (3'-phosphate/5'-hydroxy nucleic acid ligase)
MDGEVAMNITGKTLIEMGYQSGSWFPAAIKAAQVVADAGGDETAIRAAVDKLAPPPTVPLRGPRELAFRMNIRADGPEEAENIATVERHMAELMRVPTIRAGAVMPDACPAGAASGTIPVGGVIAAENAIHPGMHSADICCSMAVTIFEDHEPKRLLDSGMKRSHFGGGGRERGAQFKPPDEIMEAFAGNFFLKSLTSVAVEHFATQGDGNHFFYVGRVKSSGELALVTHHGSRKPGAMLYKYGMSAAEGFRQKLSPQTPRHNAWIPADTRQGEDYWQALQIIRAWTKASHFKIHDIVAEHLSLKRRDRFWNEHNFVFRKSDGLFYHAKGATPAFANYADDTNGLTLIPLNMREPILITRGLDAANGLGFAPHGAGRNFSRTAFLKSFGNVSKAEIVAQQTQGIDARYFCGIPDLSELPGAYKNADNVRAQIAEYGLAEVVDTIEPVGSIMAGDWQQDAPWRKKKKAKVARLRDAEADEEDEGEE